MEYTNYIQLQKLSLRYNYYVYVDTKEYLADPLLHNEHISMKFLKEGLIPPKKLELSEDYIVVICKVKKDFSEMFENCMKKFCNKMLILGYKNYEKESAEIIKFIVETAENM